MFVPLSFDDANIQKLSELASFFQENFQLFFKIYSNLLFVNNLQNYSGNFLKKDPSVQTFCTDAQDRSQWDPNCFVFRLLRWGGCIRVDMDPSGIDRTDVSLTMRRYTKE